MSESKRIRSAVPGLALAALLMVTGLPAAMAADLSNPELVVDGYLNSLVNGDTSGLLARLDERMKNKNRALELSPETYSEFLKKRYQGVQTTVEGFTAQGDKMRARVRFDYPAAQSSVIVFILTERDGQWLISGEEY